MTHELPPTYDERSDTPAGDVPFQKTVYDSRELALGPEDAVRAQWASGFLKPVHNAGSASTFRTTPDSNAPPPAAEHALIPPQLQSDPAMLALRPHLELWHVTSPRHILTSPVSTVQDGGGREPESLAADEDAPRRCVVM
jgi:hypothetical protein